MTGKRRKGRRDMKKITEKTEWFIAADGAKFLTEAECLKHERADPIKFLSAALKVDEALLRSIADGMQPELAVAWRAIATMEFRARKANGAVKRRGKPNAAPTKVDGVTTNAPQGDDDGSEEQ